MDHNDDGFLDLPKSNQINVANRWLYAADNGLQVRWGWKYVRENRLGGMADYRKSLYDQMLQSVTTDKPLYGSEIRNRGANAYFKLGMPVGPASTTTRSRTRCVRTSLSWLTSTTSTRTPISV